MKVKMVKTASNILVNSGSESNKQENPILCEGDAAAIAMSTTLVSV